MSWSYQLNSRSQIDYNKIKKYDNDLSVLKTDGIYVKRVKNYQEEREEKNHFLK